jgi:hypothetical protein
MATSRTDAFALKNSSLNAFLFAEVGTELNGSQLTILSTLARLGADPWAEAARWATLPKAATIDSLSYSIAQMPLCAQALADARVTASRLILLLPSPNAMTQRMESATTIAAVMPGWVPLAFFCCALAVGMGLNALLTQNAVGPAAAPIPQTTGQTP